MPRAISIISSEFHDCDREDVRFEVVGFCCWYCGGGGAVRGAGGLRTGTYLPRNAFQTFPFGGRPRGFRCKVGCGCGCGGSTAPLFADTAVGCDGFMAGARKFVIISDILGGIEPVRNCCSLPPLCAACASAAPALECPLKRYGRCTSFSI